MDDVNVETKETSKIQKFYQKNKKTIKIIGQIIYIIIFIIINSIISLKHESWADEAQAWLIARDNSFLGILKNMKYEGTPGLWHIILKISILFGLQYENIQVITITFTVIGIIFLFKNEKIPVWMKILLPYTYFVFFQYTVVARSYNLFFPLIMITAYIYPHKDEKRIIYGILIYAIANVSVHGLLLAGGLWLDFALEKWKKRREEKGKFEKKDIIFLTILAISFFIPLIIAFPASDCSYEGIMSFNWIETIAQTMFTSKNNNIIITVISFTIVLVLCAIMIMHKKTLESICILLPNLIFIAFILGGAWHIGVLFYIILFLAIINDSIDLKIVRVIFLVSMIIQIYWSAVCSYNDYNYGYASGKVVSEYLKEIGYENKTIYGSSFWSVQANPYFEKNIYDNFSKSYYAFKISEDQTKLAKELLYKKPMADIYVVPIYFHTNYNEETIDKEIKNSKEYLLIRMLERYDNYEEKIFESKMYYKDITLESTTLYVFTRQEI